MSKKGQVGLINELKRSKDMHKSTNQKRKSKKRKGKAKKWTENQIVKLADKSGIESQKMQVRYHQRLTTNMNPYNGIFDCTVQQTQLSGLDQLLPNYATLTQGQRKIWIEYITIYVVFNENDTELNATSRNFIRHMLVYKDDETDAGTQDVEDMFKYTGVLSLNNMEISLNAVLPQNGHIYPRQDSGWIPYDSELSTSLGSGFGSDTNFRYPYKRFRKTLNIKKEFQINDNGTLIDFSIPTLAMFFTGALAESPDVHSYFHFYYKVLA